METMVRAYSIRSSLLYSTENATIMQTKVASGSDDSTIMVWNVETGRCVRTLTGHRGPVRSLFLLANGHLASGSIERDSLGEATWIRRMRQNTCWPHQGRLLSAANR